jgi:hypothetical protein
MPKTGKQSKTHKGALIVVKYEARAPTISKNNII